MFHKEILKKLSSNLINTYENAIHEDSGNIGKSREAEIIKFLERVMPQKYGFKSGEVFDQSGKKSDQTDIILHDKLFSSILTDGSENIVVPVESTYGVISVKSKMGTKELDHAIKGIKKYESLKRPKPEKGEAYILPDLKIVTGNGVEFEAPPPRNINCIFAFETTVANATLLKKVEEAKCVDLLVVPNAYCVIGRKRDEFSFSDESKIVSDCAVVTQDSVPMFTILLQLYLCKNKLISADVSNIALEIIRSGNIMTQKK